MRATVMLLHRWYLCLCADQLLSIPRGKLAPQAGGELVLSRANAPHGLERLRKRYLAVARLALGQLWKVPNLLPCTLTLEHPAVR